MKQKKLYRPNVGIMLLNNRGDVFMAHRTDSRKQAWQMPQGGIDKGEDEYDAALRELYEETNISSVALIAESKHWYSYDFPAGVQFLSEKKKLLSDRRRNGFYFSLPAGKVKSIWTNRTPNSTNGNGRRRKRSLT